MRLSWRWLGEIVDLKGVEPATAAHELTMKTALVEEIEVRGELDPSIVVGKVLECSPHPNADRLRLCVVDVGDSQEQIVCGAPNVAAGQTVCVARPGARLPDGTKLRRARIRGVESAGMICSERELGLGEDHDGILVLDEGPEVGRPVREVPEVCDCVFEIDNQSITHRPDLWGHEGFARELAALLGRELRPPREREDLAPGAGVVEIRIEDERICGRYLAARGEGPWGACSPGWMRLRLLHVAQRPIGLAVDLSNYVMLELGQPTHPFDRERLEGDRIEVRRSRAGEKIRTLDGVERPLPEGTLVIADERRPIAVAGVIGGMDSGISEESRRLVLESAWFDPVTVRRSARALGLRTEASSRFEKGLDPALAERAVRRFADLAARCGGSVEGLYDEAGSRREEQPRIVVSAERISLRLGYPIEAEEARSALEALRFETALDGGELEIVVPSWRARDVKGEADVVEEIGRILGYERVPETLPRLECRPSSRPAPRDAAWAVGCHLRLRFGFTEVLSYPFVPEGLLERIGGPGEEPYVLVKNPPQKDARRLRRSLVPWLLEFVDRNVKAHDEVRLFEVGRVFVPERAAEEQPAEPTMLGMVWATRSAAREETILVRRIQGAVEGLAEALERPVRLWRPTDGGVPVWAHPGRAALVRSGEEPIGWLAEVHPDLAERSGWTGPCAVVELDLERWTATPRRPRGYRRPSRHPASWFDLSFVASFELPFERIRQALLEGVEHAREVSCVDEFRRKEGLEPDERSLTVRVRLEAEDHTLSEEEVERALDRAKSVLEGLGARLRGEEAGGR